MKLTWSKKLVILYESMIFKHRKKLLNRCMTQKCQHIFLCKGVFWLLSWICHFWVISCNFQRTINNENMPCWTNSTYAQYITLWKKSKWRKSKIVNLVQQNDFGPTFLHRMLRLVKVITKPNTYYWLARICSFPCLCNPSFNFMGGVGKR
jgi:hypothetical protein